MKLRFLTGGTVAYAVWLMPNGTFRTVKLTQDEFNAWATVGNPPRQPHPKAVFCMAAGGVPALNTADGWPSIGDCWERPDDIFGKVLEVCTGLGPDWSYSPAFASDPIDNKFSRLTGFRAASIGNRVRRIDYNRNALPDMPVVLPRLLSSRIDQLIPNHHSVTFDASSHAGADTNTLTWSHTVASQTNRYLAAGCAWRQRSITAATYNAVSLTDRVATNAGDARCNIRDIVAPDTGANNVSFTMNLSASYMSGSAISAYGVDQTTPTGDTDSVEGSSTGPAITITSEADGLVFTMLSWTSFGGETNTPDAGWNAITADGDTVNSGQGAYKSGAASVTRTDALSGSTDWCIQGVAIKAAAGGAAADFMRFL